MTQYAMVIDLERCLGCHTCALTCRSAWGVEPPAGRCVVESLGPETVGGRLTMTSYVAMCGHCDRPRCVDACPVPLELKTFTGGDGRVFMRRVAATWKDPFTGLVAIDAGRCTGCGACVDACPYKARRLRGRGGKTVADACTFCAPRLAQGARPACVENCLAGAMIFGDLEDPRSEAAAAVRKGALRQPAAGGAAGVNLYYLGRSQDLALLRARLPGPRVPE